MKNLINAPIDTPTDAPTNALTNALTDVLMNTATNAPTDATIDAPTIYFDKRTKKIFNDNVFMEQRLCLVLLVYIPLNIGFIRSLLY